MQIPKLINGSLSSLYSLWNTISESCYTRKAHKFARNIRTTYLQSQPAMAAASESRWSHVTFMARNEHHPRSRVFSPSFAPVVLYFIRPFQFSLLLAFYLFFYPLNFLPVTRFLVTLYSVTRFSNTPHIPCSSLLRQTLRVTMFVLSVICIKWHL